jgi:hypothetical protein
VQDFLHVLVFRCPKCARPLAVSCLSDERTFEAADAHLFNPHCHCGLTGSLAGFIAVKHWVEPWETPPDTKAALGEGRVLRWKAAFDSTSIETVKVPTAKT